MKVVICEDHPIHRENLLLALNRWAETEAIDLAVEPFENAEDLMRKMDLLSEADGFFLDIYLPGKSGYDIAVDIRERDKEIPIIFISSSGEYLRQGYEVSAYRYLVKPFEQRDIETCMNYCKTFFEEKDTRSFLLKHHRETKRFRYSDIMLFSSEGHTLRILTRNGEVSAALNESFAEFIAGFPSSLFLRCHQSFCVNLQAVSRYTSNELVLSNGKQVPISRHYRKETLEKLDSFFLTGG